MATFNGGSLEYILASIPFHLDGGASSTITNVSAETAFTCVLTGMPAVVDNRLCFAGWIKLVVDPGDGCRLRLRAGLASAALTAGAELALFDFADSGQIYFEGSLNITAIGDIATGRIDLQMNVITGGAIGPSSTPVVLMDEPVDLSGVFQLGWTLEDQTTWSASSTGELRTMKGGQIADRIP
jgi:hypothetical protein